MKLLIELDSKTLHKAVEAQVEKAIAELTEKVIIEKVNSIIEKKVDRTSDTLIIMAVETQISKKIETAMTINDIRNKINNKIMYKLKKSFSEN